MNLRFSLALFLALALSVPAKAQSISATPASENPLHPPSPGQLLAADALIGSIYSASSFNLLIDQVLQTQLAARPEIKVYEQEMRAFFTKYMNFEALRPHLADAYAKKFTEAELWEMTRFYQSPTGKKMASLLPQMMQAGGEIGKRLVTTHLAELQDAMAAKMASQK